MRVAEANSLSAEKPLVFFFFFLLLFFTCEKNVALQAPAVSHLVLSLIRLLQFVAGCMLAVLFVCDRVAVTPTADGGDIHSGRFASLRLLVRQCSAGAAPRGDAQQAHDRRAVKREEGGRASCRERV